ncbi:hypothetical protein M3Y99_01004000 [Aphelenchoides fujianensis]|nr:hypothetical protein M3Y99_01004000 [Aphelenchoides fujianensis]
MSSDSTVSESNFGCHVNTTTFLLDAKPPTTRHRCRLADFLARSLFLSCRRLPHHSAALLYVTTWLEDEGGGREFQPVEKMGWFTPGKGRGWKCVYLAAVQLGDFAALRLRFSFWFNNEREGAYRQEKVARFSRNGQQHGSSGVCLLSELQNFSNNNGRTMKSSLFCVLLLFVLLVAHSEAGRRGQRKSQRPPQPKAPEQPREPNVPEEAGQAENSAVQRVPFVRLTEARMPARSEMPKKSARSWRIAEFRKQADGLPVGAQLQSGPYKLPVLPGAHFQLVFVPKDPVEPTASSFFVRCVQLGAHSTARVQLRTCLLFGY